MLYVARTLGLGDRIDTEDWIGQAARLVAARAVANAPASVTQDGATVASQLLNASVPLPLSAWKYGRTTRPPLSISETMAILGLTASDADEVVPPEPMPDPMIASVLADEAAAPPIKIAQLEAVADTSKIVPAMPLPASAYVLPCAEPPLLESWPDYAGPPPKPLSAQRYWFADMIGVAHRDLDPALPLPASAYAVPREAEPDSEALAAGPITTASNEIPKLTSPPTLTPPPISQVFEGAKSGQVDTLRWAVDMVRETTAIESLFARSLGDQTLALPAGSEAHVTIRRAEDAISNAVRHAPRGTVARASDLPDGHDFDAGNYAAYRGQVEEASVEIVRAGTLPAELPPPPHVKPSGADRFRAPAPSQIGRLFKTLTGQ